MKAVFLVGCLADIVEQSVKYCGTGEFEIPDPEVCSRARNSLLCTKFIVRAVGVGRETTVLSGIDPLVVDENLALNDLLGSVWLKVWLQDELSEWDIVHGKVEAIIVEIVAYEQLPCKRVDNVHHRLVPEV